MHPYTYTDSGTNIHRHTHTYTDKCTLTHICSHPHIHTFLFGRESVSLRHRGGVLLYVIIAKLRLFFPNSRGLWGVGSFQPSPEAHTIVFAVTFLSHPGERPCGLRGRRS